MPYKGIEKKRTYFRNYMRRRRTAVKLVKPQGSKEEPPRRFIAWNRPYHVEERYPYPAYLVQDGMWYDLATVTRLDKGGMVTMTGFDKVGISRPYCRLTTRDTEEGSTPCLISLLTSLVDRLNLRIYEEMGEMTEHIAERPDS